MKHYILSLSFMFLSALAFGQLPTLVSAPILESTAASQEATMTTMSATIATLQTSEASLREFMRSATWARNLGTARKLVSMIQNTICTTQNLNVKMAAFGGNCLFQYHFDIHLVNLGFAADQVGMVIADGIEMTTGERLQTIDNAIAKFERAQTGLSNLNGWLDQELYRRTQKTNINKNVDFLMTAQIGKKI